MVATYKNHYEQLIFNQPWTNAFPQFQFSPKNLAVSDGWLWPEMLIFCITKNIKTTQITAVCI